MKHSLLNHLEEMGAEVEETLERLMGDEELYLTYLQKLPDNQNIVALRAAVMAGDADTAMREVHTLKGVALNLGLLPLSDVCMDMLLAFRAGETEAAMALLPEVEEEFQVWSDALFF